MTAPRCAIVIPAFNAARFIGAAIESVLAQSVADWELIIVDDASTDDTLLIAARYSDPRIRLMSIPHAGVAAARNAGIREAAAPCILFLDADDLLLPDALERLLGALERDPPLVAAYGEAVTCGESGAMIGTQSGPVFTSRPSGDVLRQIVRQNFVATPGVLCARTSAVREAGGFPEALPPHEDWALWCALAARGPFAYIGLPPVLAYRIHAGSAMAAQGTDLSPALRAMEHVFQLPEIREQLGPDLNACRRARTAAAHALAATRHLRARNWASARRHLLHALRFQPARPREWALLPFALTHWLPPFLLHRLK